jgi:hypothetical protein
VLDDEVDVADRAEPVVGGVRQVVEDLDRDPRLLRLLESGQPAVVVAREPVVGDDVDPVQPGDGEELLADPLRMATPPMGSRGLGRSRVSG